MTETFDVKKHLIKVQGGRQYLPVAARVLWFRSENPGWGIETHMTVSDFAATNPFVVYTAVIKDEDGRVIGQGTKMCSRSAFGDFVEKAESGAIGRALALCGYGTQFADLDDEMDNQYQGGSSSYQANNNQGSRRQAEVIEPLPCDTCSTMLTSGQMSLSMRKYGKPLCPDCQKKVV